MNIFCANTYKAVLSFLGTIQSPIPWMRSPRHAVPGDPIGWQRTELTLCSLMTNYSVEVPVPRFRLWDLRQVASLLSCIPDRRGHSQYLPTRGKWGMGRGTGLFCFCVCKRCLDQCLNPGKFNHYLISLSPPYGRLGRYRLLPILHLCAE